MVHTGTSFWLGKSPGEVSNTAMMSIAGASGIWGGVGHEEEMEEWWLRWWYGEEGTIIGTGLDEERSSSLAAAWFRAQAEPARSSGSNDGSGPGARFRHHLGADPAYFSGNFTNFAENFF